MITKYKIFENDDRVTSKKLVVGRMYRSDFFEMKILKYFLDANKYNL